MIIKVDNFRLRVIDKMNFGVEEIGVIKEGNKMAGKEYVISCKFYPNLELAILHLFNCLSNKAFSESDDLKNMSGKLEGYHQSIIKQLKEA